MLSISLTRPLNNASFCHSGLDKPAPAGCKPGESSNDLKILDSGLRRNDDRETEMEFFKGLLTHPVQKSFHAGQCLRGSARFDHGKESPEDSRTPIEFSVGPAAEGIHLRSRQTG